MKARVSDLTAIFFAVFGFTCWVLGDSCIKWIGQYGLPPEEIVAFMGFFMAITLALQAAVRRRLGNLRPRSVVRQVFRALLDMTNNVCVVIALRHLSLTMFYILVFTSPMVISLLSAVFLGERITPKKALALLVGFAGVVIAVDPFSHAQHIDLIGLASCLVCVACFSVNMVWSRVLTRTEPPESVAFCSGLVTAMAGLALTSFHPQPLTPTLWLALGMMGVFCAAGTLSFYFAVKHTSASNVSQFHYTVDHRSLDHCGPRTNDDRCHQSGSVRRSTPVASAADGSYGVACETATDHPRPSTFARSRDTWRPCFSSRISDARVGPKSQYDCRTSATAYSRTPPLSW
jgi:drug/metabolite transporter (DMT)-like permease